ncbi:hypothetical protein ABIA39_004305 [Nocardia sp. GAS34]|uniref:hypothetical protein n=1 Tax=unclassified Nocardia TaxID=2637762 RepID=UPI003D1DAEF0
MLPVTSHLGIVHMPMQLAKRALGRLRTQGTSVPLLARHIRWTMLTSVDYSPDSQILDLLSHNNICLPVTGSALMLPTSFERYTP